MAGDRGLAFVVISVISFSAFSIVGARRVPSQPKLGIIKTVPAARAAQFPAKVEAEMAAGAVQEVKRFAADSLLTMRAHLPLLEDAASRLGVELAGLNNH